MDWIVNNWFMLVVLVVVIAAIFIAIRKFFGLPKEEQLVKVREWLLYAVTMAEKEYGGGTGKLKLRYVYDLFVSKFSWIAMTITFEKFSELVDRALDEMRQMIEQNEKVKEIVQG